MKINEIIDFYLIRHAEAEINLFDVVSGRSNNSPLTLLGIKQAKSLTKRLEIIGFEDAQIISSPATRCKDTLENSLGNNVKYIINPYFQELDQGDWVGKLRSEVYNDEIKELIAKDSWNFSAPNGESQSQTAKRVISALKCLAYDREYSKKIIFTHGGAIKYSCAELFNWDKHDIFKLPVENTSITHIRHYIGNGFELVKFNSLE